MERNEAVRVSANGCSGCGISNLWEQACGRSDGTREAPEPRVALYAMETGMNVHWIDLAQDRDKWRAVVNTVMNLRGP
jgi:hypothetical protein